MSTPQDDGLQNARRKMAGLANALVAKYGVEAAIGLLQGPALVLQRAHFGDGGTVSYLLQLASEVDKESVTSTNEAN